ncbi:MAG: MFS transporter [Chloroflexi bacterium]|nr:MFS transporter [Chloroflexota bacterium]
MNAAAVLRHSHYRLLWGGQSIAFFGIGMQQLATGWLAVLIAVEEGRPELAPLYIGLMGLARGVPSIAFGLLGGVLTDWYDRRTVLRLSRVAIAASAGVLAALTIAGRANIIVLMAGVLVAAVGMSIGGPAQQVMLSRVVPPGALVDAVSLSQGTNQTVGLIGPLVAGVLIGPIGVGGVMAVNAASTVAGMLLLLGLPAAPPEGGGSQSRSPMGALRSLMGGFRYPRASPR